MSVNIHLANGDRLSITDRKAQYNVSRSGVLTIDLQGSTHHFPPHAWNAIHDWYGDDL